MTDLNYTRYATPDSSLVDEVWYNDQTQTLSVSLNGDVWAYRNVPAYVFDDLVNASSVGNTYATVVKRKYGPGDNLGFADDLDYEDVTTKPAAPRTSPAVPKDLTYNFNVDSNAEVFSLRGPVETVASADEKVSVSNDGHLSMVASAPAEVDAVKDSILPHTVTFVINGDERYYSLNSVSVYDAKETVEELGSMLGVPVQVIGVYVSFE